MSECFYSEVARPLQQPVQAGSTVSISLHMDRCHPLFSPLYESAKSFNDELIISWQVLMPSPP